MKKKEQAQQKIAEAMQLLQQDDDCIDSKIVKILEALKASHVELSGIIAKEDFSKQKASLDSDWDRLYS